MKTITIIASSIVLLIVIIVVFGRFYLTHFFTIFDLCGEDLPTEKISPDHVHVAREFRIDCGATTDWAAAVNLKNTITGKEQRVLSLNGDLVKSCSVKWLDDKSLDIRCSSFSNEVYNRQSEFEGVKITFDQGATH